MALRLAWSAESKDSGSPEIVSATGTLNFNQAQEFNGSPSVRATPSSAAAQIILRGLGATGVGADFGLATIYGGAWFRRTGATLPTANITFGFATSGNTLMARISFQDTNGGRFQCAYLNSSNTQTTLGSVPMLNADEDHYLEIGVINSNVGGSTTIIYRIDGVEVFRAENTQIGSAPTTVARVILGNASAHSGDYFWSSVYADDAGFLDAPPIMLRDAPNGAGTDTGWTTTATGNTFAEVDEIPHDGDTSYRRTATNNNAFTSALTNRTFPGTMVALKSVAVTRDEGSANARTSVRTRSGSTVSNTTAVRPGTSFVQYAALHLTDPATSAAWTQSGYDAVQVGATAGAAQAVRCTAAYGVGVFVPVRKSGSGSATVVGLATASGQKGAEGSGSAVAIAVPAATGEGAEAGVEGSGTITVVGLATASGEKAAANTGSAAAIAVPAGAGEKGALADGSSPAIPAPVGTGQHDGQGGATAAAVGALAASGQKGAADAGTAVAVPVPSATGQKGAEAAITIAAIAVPAATGEAGSVPALEGAGTITVVAEPTAAGRKGSEAAGVSPAVAVISASGEKAASSAGTAPATSQPVATGLAGRESTAAAGIVSDPTADGTTARMADVVLPVLAQPTAIGQAGTPETHEGAAVLVLIAALTATGVARWGAASATWGVQERGRATLTASAPRAVIQRPDDQPLGADETATVELHIP